MLITKTEIIGRCMRKEIYIKIVKIQENEYSIYIFIVE